MYRQTGNLGLGSTLNYNEDFKELAERVFQSGYNAGASSADSCESSASSEGFFFPAKPTENRIEEPSKPARAPLGLSSLDNKPAPSASSGKPLFGAFVKNVKCKAVSRVYCESGAFYAGNERSTSLVTAIPAETESETIKSLDATTVLLDKIINTQQQRKTITITSPELRSGSVASPGDICSTGNYTIQELLSSPTLSLKVLSAIGSPHVSFASPLAQVNVYTPEFDPNSSTTEGDNAFYSKMGPPSGALPFSFKQAIANVEKELAEIEAMEQLEKEKEAARYSQLFKNSANWPKEEIILEATKGVPIEIVDEFLHVMNDLSTKMGKIQRAISSLDLEGTSAFCVGMGSSNLFKVGSSSSLYMRSAPAFFSEKTLTSDLDVFEVD